MKEQTPTIAVSWYPYIQDSRQIVDGKTNDIENNNKKVGPDF